MIQHGFIAIEGIIGAGKSTLAKLLSQDLPARLMMEEFEDNSFLPKFYQDPERYAFPLEMSFLAARYNQYLRQLVQNSLFEQGLVSDYIIQKCLIFSKSNLDRDEYELYTRMFDIILSQLPAPDLLIYLHVTPEKAKQNIYKRGRSYEQEIQIEYLQNLQKGYLELIHAQKHEWPIIMIAANEADFLHNPLHFSWIKDQIQKSWSPGIHTLFPPGVSADKGLFD